MTVIGGGGRRASAWLSLGALLCLPPSLLSEQGFARVGLGLCLLSFLILLVQSGPDQLYLSGTHTPLITITLALEVYIWLQSVIMESRIASIVLQSGTSTLIVLTLTAFALSDRTFALQLRQAFILSMLCASISGVITWVLILLGVSIESLTVSHVRLYRNSPAESLNDVLFPFTVTASGVRWFGAFLPRSTGWAREPGMGQLYFVAALLLPVAGSRRRRRSVKTILSVGVATTGSTAGLASLSIVVVVLLLTGGPGAMPWSRYARGVLSLLAVWCGYLALVALPSAGLASKAASSGSVDDRWSASIRGLAEMSEHPLGVGLGNSDDATAGINLLAQSGQLGLLGVGFVALSCFASVLGGERTPSVIAFSSALFLTALTSQPATNSTGLYVLLLVVAAGGGGAVLWVESHGAVSGQTCRPSTGQKIGVTC